MAKNKSSKPKGIKASDLSIGDRLEDGRILGMTKVSGRYYLLVEERGKYTILTMAANCITTPHVARNIPEEAMEEMVDVFKNNS